ncbi:MAG: hypothetical protein AAB454_00370 [Patescibacteria group bacterium]
MENNKNNQSNEIGPPSNGMENETQLKQKNNYLLPASIFLSTVIIAAAVFYVNNGGGNSQANILNSNNKSEENLEGLVLPPNGVELPIRWEDLGVRMIKSGVIDADKIEALYAERGGLNEEMRRLLYSSDNGALTITQNNSSYILNLLWALGLGNRNEILDEGPMMNPRYGGAGKFASTGGWTLAKNDSMNHYSMHSFVVLSPEQQALVDRVSKNIYRPCCGNSVYFPDCNHGMAMLGLLELMAAQGVSEKEMYKAALIVNSYWFPDTYLAIAKYFGNRGINWNKVDAKIALGQEYSSASGYKRVLEEIEPQQIQGGGGCSV